MSYPEVTRSRKAARRYSIYYYRIVGDFTRQDTSGATDDLAAAYGNAAKHCAMSELRRGEYAQALVIDRRMGRIVRSYKHSAGGDITTKDF